MSVQVLKQFFATKEQALEDIVKTSFWPTTFVSEASPPLDVHWHDTDIHGYVIEGHTWVLDSESGERLQVAEGDKLIIPAGTLHAEGETRERVVYIVAVPDPRPVFEFLKMHAPDDPDRPGLETGER